MLSVILTRLSLLLGLCVRCSSQSRLLTATQSKKATEADLRREFEMYGAIERVRIVRDRKQKSHSYAFVVYERERDMKG